MPHTPEDPLHMTDFAESVLFPIFSSVFYNGSTSWQTDTVLAAVIRALTVDTVDEAVTIMLEVLDVDPIALRESLVLSGRYDPDFDFRDTPTNDLAPEDTLGGVNAQLDDLRGQINDLAQIIEDYINTGVLDVKNDLGRIGSLIIDDIIEDANRAEGVITGVLNTINDGIDDSRGVLDRIWERITGTVTVEIENRIVIPADVFEVIVRGIGDILDAERSWIVGVIDLFSDAITQLFRDYMEREFPELIAIEQAIRDQTTAEVEADDELLDEVKEINNDTIDGTGASMAKGVGLVIEEGINRSDVGTAKSWADAIQFDQLLGCSENEIEDWIREKGIIDGVSGKIVFEIMLVVGKAMGLLSIGGAIAAKELYEFSLTCDWEILEAGDAVAAYHRGLISRSDLTDEIKMRGYSAARTETLIETAYVQPGAGELYSMNLRGLAGGENLTERFKGLGFNPTDAQSLADLKFYIPGPQDLITMAVREVFSPEIVKKFGQDQDFPEDFATYAEQQGISRFWAEKYWQAHWVLPSVQMGFEMLHRRVIDEQTLRQLMAAQDIMPGWRDELIAISYRPYTRVDIRRMHDTGVLSEAEVYDAYRDIGYNDEKARTLTEFTIELNRDDPDPLEPLDGLTRSAVISAYKDGLIDRITAEGLLEAEGVGPDARLIYLNDAELDIEKELRNDQSQTLLIEYENAAISLRQAAAALSALPLTPLEQEKVELKLRRITAKRTKLPSKADLQKLYKESIIGKGTFKDEMERLGYPDRWVDDYIKLVKLGITVDDEPTA